MMKELGKSHSPKLLTGVLVHFFLVGIFSKNHALQICLKIHL